MENKWKIKEWERATFFSSLFLLPGAALFYQLGKKEGISSFSFRYFLTMVLITLEQDNGKLWPLTESRIVIKSMKKQYSYDILSQPFSLEIGFLSSLLSLVQSPFPRASNAAWKAVMTPLCQRKDTPVDTGHNDALCVTSLPALSQGGQRVLRTGATWG